MILYAIGNNTIRLNSAFLGITQAPVPPTPTYNGFTYSTTGASTFIFDPAQGVSKNIAVHYEQVDGDWSLDCTGNADPNGSPGDCPNLYAPSAGTYVMSFDSSDYENDDGGVVNSYAYSISSIEVYDFMHKGEAFLKINDYYTDQSVFVSCNRIPTATSGWINAESLTSVAKAFYYCPITGALEPSITSLSAAAPNLSNVSNCFGGCIGASDYAHCLTAYPDWFNDNGSPSRVQCPDCGGTGQVEMEGPCNCIHCSTCGAYGTHSDYVYFDENTGEWVVGPCPHYSDDNPDGVINPDPNCSECGGTGAVTGYGTCGRCGGTGWIEE